MDTPYVVAFPDSEDAPRAAVGGKGHSLIRMAAASLPVPSGAVLTTSFFEPWLGEMAGTETWSALTAAEPGDWPPFCDALKTRCRSLPLTPAQEGALTHLHEHLAARYGDAALFAVRSSSPDEDLESASFAGGYETRLGVPLAGLEDAVRQCCASSLDARVLVYKREHGFDDLTPRLAVVVQEQVASEVSGVGFSLNPVTNDYDEAYIDANWGLGTTVVEGRVSPDHFVVNKVDGCVLEATTGRKETSAWLAPAGGTEERTEEREGSRAADRTLGDAQLRELTGVLGQIEALYGYPVDVEWAYAGGRLCVLQARPVTRYVPLHPSLCTEPGARRRLYADTGLAKGMTINAPISPMGQAAIEDLGSQIAEWLIGDVDLGLSIDESLLIVAPGRSYQNLSALLTVARPERLAKGFEETDSRVADILRSVDADRYRLPDKPSWARLPTLLRVLPRVTRRSARMLTSGLWVLLAPDRAWETYRKGVEAFEAHLSEGVDFSLPLGAFRRRYLGPSVVHFLEVTGPAFGGAFAVLQGLDRLVGPSSEMQVLAQKLKCGFRGEVVTEMGLALYRLAQRLNPKDFHDLPRLADRIERRDLPSEVLRDWDAFLNRWGCRGPNEMDLAQPRYADRPELALRQMSYMATGQADFDPVAAHERLVAEREQAYDALMGRLGRARRALLRRSHRVIERFAGARDTPKHHLVLALAAVRRRVLIEGQRLTDEGLLDAPEDVFGLTFGDLEASADDPSLDLRAVRDERLRFVKRLETHVGSFPPVIDSRGRILRPPSQAIPGGFRGMPVSPGVAVGPVKVLRDAHEKPVERGDVLVATTADPGWTPLFVNAAAVVLEVGGALQHGAIVAREFGKPCVVGIDRATDLFEDGQRVEVDGSEGTVRAVS